MPLCDAIFTACLGIPQPPAAFLARQRLFIKHRIGGFGTTWSGHQNMGASIHTSHLWPTVLQGNSFTCPSTQDMAYLNLTSCVHTQLAGHPQAQAPPKHMFCRACDRSRML